MLPAQGSGSHGGWQTVRAFVVPWIKKFWTLSSCGVLTGISLYQAYKHKDNDWYVKVSLGAGGGFMLFAAMKTWYDEYQGRLLDRRDHLKELAALKEQHGKEMATLEEAVAIANFSLVAELRGEFYNITIGERHGMAVDPPEGRPYLTTLEIDVSLTNRRKQVTSLNKLEVEGDGITFIMGAITPLDGWTLPNGEKKKFVLKGTLRAKDESTLRTALGSLKVVAVDDYGTRHLLTRRLR